MSNVKSQANGDTLAVGKNKRAHVWHPFSQEKTAAMPIEIVRGEGVKVFDANGKTYLDLISSWWVNMHGHAHPTIAQAIADQAHTLEHVIFAGFTHPTAIELCEKLCELLPAPLNRVFFSECGSAAVEISIKMAVQYWHNRGQKRNRIVAFNNGYHGDTFGAMAAGKASHFFEPFEEMMFQVSHVPYANTWIDDADVEQKEADSLRLLNLQLEQFGQETAAIIIEPLIQGAGGMKMCRPEFLEGIQKLAREHDVLLIFDEVMTGFGRTGKMFACELSGVTPDIICLAKGLTGGFVPLAVTVAGEHIYEAFLSDDFSAAFAHGHSYTANPLGCAAGLASLKVFQEEDTLNRTTAIEQTHLEQLARLSADDFPLIRPRVRGDIAAFDLPSENSGYHAPIGSRLKKAFVEAGLIIRPLGNTVYLMPPYCVEPEQLVEVYEQMTEIIKANL